MRRRWGTFVALIALWVALWGDPRPANLLSGVVVASGVLVADRAASGAGHLVHVHPLHAARLVVWMVGQIVRSSARLAWEVLTPTNSIAMGVVHVPLRTVSDVHTLIVANCVTLTPGTISIDVIDGPTSTLVVHALHLHDPDALVRETHALEERVIRAFGEPNAVVRRDET